MKQKIYIISTVGASILTNQCGNNGKLRTRFFQLSNSHAQDISGENKKFVDDLARLANANLQKANEDGLKRLSAELNAILTFQSEEKNINTQSQYTHLLLTTDTYAGHFSGEILNDWLNNQEGHTASLRPLKDLRTNDIKAFRSALANIAAELHAEVLDYKKAGYKVIFNLTGGFKGANGFMQTLAMLTEAETIYLFEGSKTLMTIPALPIKLSFSSLTEDNFSLFRRIGMGEIIKRKQWEKAGLMESLLEIDGDEAFFNEWGQLLWADIWNKKAASIIFSPFSSHAELSESVKNQIEGYMKNKPERQWRQVNHALDILSLWSENPSATRPENEHKIKSFHNKGKRYGSATHEIYANDTAARILFHKNNNKVVIDQIIDHPKKKTG